MGFSSI
jgi:hypothetical protein